MAEKRYYWLKLQQRFFNSPEIKVLRRVSGGDTYTVIYLEMLLLSLENDGYLYFEHYGDDMADELAAVLNEGKENVSFLLAYLETHRLITISEDTYYLNSIKNMIGSEAASARRMRRLRENKKAIDTGVLNSKASQIDGQASHSDSVVTKRDTEIELEKDIELEKEVEVVEESKEENQKPATTTSEVQESPFTFFQKNGFGQISGFIGEDIQQWLGDFTKAGATEQEANSIMIKAMKIAIERNKANWGYVKAILKDWDYRKLISIQAIEADQASFEAKQRQRQAKPNQWQNANRGVPAKRRPHIDLGY